MEQKTAVGYIRVSTEEQARGGISLDAQQERLEGYCRAAGLELVQLVREEGVSGAIALSSRPGGKQLLDFVAHKDVRDVVALKLDRLFRDAIDALTQTRAWDKAGIALHLVDMGGQSVNTASAMGRMMLTMMAGFAELERNLIAERTAAALGHKKAHRRVYSPTPFGFERNGDVLTPRHGEQEIIQRLQGMARCRLEPAADRRHLEHRWGSSEGRRPALVRQHGSKDSAEQPAPG